MPMSLERVRETPRDTYASCVGPPCYTCICPNMPTCPRKVKNWRGFVRKGLLGLLPNLQIGCIGPSQTTNKSIKRPKYTIPTIEEKVPLVTKAKVFTTLDVYLKHSKPLYWLEIPLYSRRFRGQPVAIAITTCRSVLLLVRRNTSGGSMNS